jgi:hypothetical protein
LVLCPWIPAEIASGLRPRNDEIKECSWQAFFTLTLILSHRGRGNFAGNDKEDEAQLARDLNC